MVEKVTRKFYLMPHSTKKPFFRFLLILFILIGCGGFLRMLYHYIPGCVSFVSHSWFIDTFYRLLFGPVHFLLTLTGIANSIGYSQQGVQYFIHLQGANVNLFLWIPCLGISLMYIYTSLIIAFPNPLKKKLVFIIFGNLIIQVLNVIRLYGLLLLIDYTHVTQTQFSKLPWLAINHETIFNYGVIFLIFLLFGFYAKDSKRISGSQV